MFVNTRRKYTWKEIRDCYERGSAAIDCQRQFGISNGAWYAAVQRGAIALRRGVDTRPPGKTREAVGRMLGQGMSQAAIARALGISNPTVCFHVRKLGIEPRSALATRYDWERVRAYYDAGNSAAECRRQFGFSLSAWADAIRRGAIVARPRLEPLDSILAVGRELPRARQSPADDGWLEAGALRGL